MLGGLLLLPNEVTHEIAQKLRGIAVTGFGGVGELGLQRLIDPESKGCFAHGLTPNVLSNYCNVTQQPSRLRRQRDPRLSSIERMAEAMGMTVLIVPDAKAPTQPATSASPPES